MTGSWRSTDGEGQAVLAAALRDAAAGDRNALRIVFDRTSAKLMGICVRILKDQEEAEDALQDIFVSVWQRAGTFDPAKASPITWLATIARNRAIDRLRSRRTRDGGAPVDQALGVPDETPDAFAAAVSAQESGRLHGCMGELEDRTGRMIRAAFFDGLSYAQLAARDSVPLGTVKSWVRRGLQQLRRCLER